MHPIQYDFFLSHPGQAIRQAKALYDLLQPHCQVFLDEEALQPGDNWGIELQQALEQSRFIIALLDGTYGAAYYAQEELSRSLNMERQHPGRYSVVPVYLNGFPQRTEDIPFGIFLKHSLNVQKEGGLEGIAKKLLLQLQSDSGTAELKVADNERNMEHPLQTFPRGPMVEAELIKRSLIEAYAAFLRPHEFLQVIAEANYFRKQADPGDEHVTTIQPFHVPPPQTVSALQFWMEVFREARLHGPRMLAALVLVVPEDQFPPNARQARTELLQQIAAT